MHSSGTLRALLSVALVAAFLLSGCAGGKNSGPKAVNDPTVEPTVTADKGAIAGFVLTDESLPIANAQVLIRGAGADTTLTTNAEGEFAASELEPGDYTVAASRIGHNTAQKRVTVIAAEISHVTLFLVPEQLEGTPYSVPIGPIKGKFFCAWGTSEVSGPCRAYSTSLTEPIWQQISGGENNIFEYRTIIEENKTIESDQLANMVVELTWNPVAPSAKWLRLNIEDLPAEEGSRNLSEPKWARTSGEGPLRMVVAPGTLNAGGDLKMPLNAPGFLVGVFPGVDPAAPDVPGDLGIKVAASAYLEQPFEFWITLFYNEPAPEGFTQVPT